MRSCVLRLDRWRREALAVFAGIAIALSLSPVDLREVALDTRLGSVLVFAAAAALVAWRYPAACSLALPLGVPLAVLAWFAPYLAVGFGLLLLAFHCGSIALWGAAIPYLGFGLCIYYYNLDISLLHKSLVLMGSGLLLLIISRALIRPGRVPVKRGAQS